MQFKEIATQIKGFINRKPIDALYFLGFVLVTLILVRLYFSMNPDDAKWEQFKAEHDCQLRMSKTGTQRASWSCNDGKTYYRWRQQR